MLQRTDIKKELIKLRKKTSSKETVLSEVYKIIQEKDNNASADFSVLNKYGSNISINEFNIDSVEAENIFHIGQIKKICIDYRLRFLDSKYFKGTIPSDAIFKIEKLEAQHQTSLDNFKIMAPSKLFKLENADDPLLFAPMGNDYFYLLHKWGNDFHPMRKLLMKPFKCLENFLIFIFLLSFLVAVIIPLQLFGQEGGSVQLALIFLFTFKSIIGISIFYGFAQGKDFSESIWNSKYFNS